MIIGRAVRGMDLTQLPFTLALGGQEYSPEETWFQWTFTWMQKQAQKRFFFSSYSGGNKSGNWELKTFLFVENQSS